MLDDQSPAKSLMQQLIRYVEKQWLNKSTVDPSRLSVRDNQARTNNAVEIFHASLRRRIKVPHPNLFAFLRHLQQTTLDSQWTSAELPAACMSHVYSFLHVYVFFCD